MGDGELVLPSAGPEPIAVGTALAAVLGYAHGRRPLHHRPPNARTGRWVELPAFGYERFDRRPVAEGPLGEQDILTAEGLHGRLPRDSWTAMRAVLEDVGPLAAAATARAAGRPFWELPDDEFSVLAEPGTVGAALRDVGRLPAGAAGKHVLAALHHRRPDLFPLLVRSTRWQLLPHGREGDSGPEAVISRELRDNAAAFARLETELADRGVRLTRLRLHDVLLWLAATLRTATAVAMGQAVQRQAVRPQAVRSQAAQPGSRPV